MFTIIMNAWNKINESIAWLEGWFLPETINVDWSEKLTPKFAEAAKRYGKDIEIDII